mgnify:FL=1
MKIPKVNKINLFLMLLVVVVFSISWQNNNKLSLEEKLQQALDQNLDKFDVKGASAAIIFPDGKVWTVTSGISHDTITIKPDMLFAIGSITKSFVATLILKLVEEEKLALDDPLSKWLPEYPHINSSITIRQLLNHTSGIYMFWSNQQIWDDLKKDRDKVWTPEEVLSYIKEPYFEPGERFRYSNTNYLLLAMIITKITNASLSSELEQQFWQPLNISNAYLSIEEVIPENQAHVYGDNWNNDGSYLDVTFLPRAAHESITYGSGGIFITAKDLAVWSRALFEGKILKQATLDEMLDFVTFMPNGNMTGYGLGVQRYKKDYTNGKLAYGHSGANIGTSTYMAYLPKVKLTVVATINEMKHDCSEAIFKDLVKISLRELNAYSVISAFDFFPYGVILIVAGTFWTVFIVVRLRRRRKRIRALTN